MPCLLHSWEVEHVLYRRDKTDCVNLVPLIRYNLFCQQIVYYWVVSYELCPQLKSWNYVQSSMNITLYWVNPVTCAVACQHLSEGILLISRVILILLCP